MRACMCVGVAEVSLGLPAPGPRVNSYVPRADPAAYFKNHGRKPLFILHVLLFIYISTPGGFIYKPTRGYFPALVVKCIRNVF